MGVLRSVGAASLIASLWALGCSEDEPPRKPPRSDAGDSAAGSAGRGGSSGSAGSAGTGATGGGGTGGTGATFGTGNDAGDASIDASIDSPPEAPEETFDAGLQCPALAVPDPGDAADAGDAASEFVNEAGLLLRWRDWSANACRNCPAVAVECPALVATASFDPTTGALRLELAAGTAELISGTISFHWDALDDEGGYVSGTASVPFVVEKNALTADLSNQLPAGLTFIYNINVLLTDACGMASEFPELRVDRNPIDPDAGPDAGQTWRVRCAFAEN
jgi:hypothetical protein